MKTEYVILWVDDEKDSVETDRENVERFLESKGIKPNIEFIDPNDGEEDIHSQVRNVLSNPDLDLIVVDYLMDGMDGKELINLIRQSDHIFLPVVFYSSAGLDTLMGAVQDAKLDGVYLANRDAVWRKIESVVKSLLVKEETSKRTRGLLMEGVSELDSNFGMLLEKIWNNLDANQRKTLISYFAKKITQRAKDIEKARDNFPSTEDEFWGHVKEKFVTGAYDTSTRWKVLKEGLRLIDFDIESRNLFDQLDASIGGDRALFKLRNNYAHRTRQEIEKEHTKELCIEIRQELRRQSDNLKFIETNI